MSVYKRGSTYWIDYYNGDRRVREPVGTKEEARVTLGNRLEAIRLGKNQELRRIRPIPFSKGTERFMPEYVKAKSRRPATFKVRLNPLKRLGDTLLSAITRSEVKGGDLFRLQELMGHADIKMTMRYSKASPEYQRESLGFMGRPTIPVADPVGHKSRRRRRESSVLSGVY